MKKMSEPVVFFGSGPVAAESLALVAKDFDIEGVVTKPRPPYHRGEVPVLDVAGELGLEVRTVEDGDAMDALFGTKPFRSRLGVLVDFGIIVSQPVIDYFPLGIINSHFSLLPEWRGADPISFSILSGQKTTGVSLMLLTAGMDEGPILDMSTIEIPPGTTTPELTETLTEVSAEKLKQVIPLYMAGKVQLKSQESVAKAQHRSPVPTYSRKLSKNDGIIDWAKPAAELEREIRAFAEWPKSRTRFGRLEIIITSAKVVDLMGSPGTTTVVDKRPVVFCGAQALEVDRLKPAGKQEMSGEAFLVGYRKEFLSSSSG